MKKRLLSLFLALIMVLGMLPTSGLTASAEEDYELRVLTFEDADYKGGTNFAGGNDWSSLIEQESQYSGTLLYGENYGGSSKDAAYTWYDKGNTELQHTICAGKDFMTDGESWSYSFGGHAVSNYVAGDYTSYGDFKNQLTVYKAGTDGLLNGSVK